MWSYKKSKKCEMFNYLIMMYYIFQSVADFLFFFGIPKRKVNVKNSFEFIFDNK